MLSATVTEFDGSQKYRYASSIILPVSCTLKQVCVGLLRTGSLISRILLKTKLLKVLFFARIFWFDAACDCCETIKNPKFFARNFPIRFEEKFQEIQLNAKSINSSKDRVISHFMP